MAKERKECNCCIDNTSRIVSCPYCGYDVCMRCWSYFITQKIQDPFCMSCNKGFTMEFMSENFSATFMDSTYPKWRKNMERWVYFRWRRRTLFFYIS